MVSSSVPEPLREACVHRVRAVLLELRRERVITVELLSAAPDGVRVRPHLGPRDTPPCHGALVRLRAPVRGAVWTLATHVSGQDPLTLRLPGVFTREDRRAAERLVVASSALVLDAGRGPVPARLADLSLGGMGLHVAAAAAPPMGSLVSLRLDCDRGELRCLARVRHASARDGEVRLGVEFGELTAEAGQVLGRLLAHRLDARPGGAPGGERPR